MSFSRPEFCTKTPGDHGGSLDGTPLKCVTRDAVSFTVTAVCLARDEGEV